ncbi:PKD repeat-containing protein [Olivibacter domesticus]|uniref:PKD repeat-containing protein n=2 Tax=Olivibacter domesticus TaxID=407022 RepID=A0A1H7QQT6_OLID1|nr:PKD repeat-containing protein [Olivibacter domesticus]
MKYSCIYMKCNRLVLICGMALLLFTCKKEKEVPPVEDEAKPTAEFTFKQNAENDPFTFTFENASTNYQEARWQFGDDSTSLELSPTHTFLNSGNFRVKLRTKNSQDYWAEKEVLINITPDSILNFEVSREGGDNLRLSIATDMEIDSISWLKEVESTATSVVYQTFSKEESAITSVPEGIFQRYMLRVRTPNKSTVNVVKILSKQGLVNDATAEGILTVSRDNNSGAASGEGSSKLVDNNPGTKFLQFDYKGDLWCKLEFSDPKVLSAYTITAADDAEDRDPKEWKLEGSNDDENWTILDERNEEEFAERFQVNSYTFNNTAKYKYYRISFTANRGSGLIQMAEWRVLEIPQD